MPKPDISFCFPVLNTRRTHLRRILGVANPVQHNHDTATTREYKEKGSHDEIRKEHHDTRAWKKDKRILRRNTKEATDEEHDWGKGEVIERLMWAKWRGKTRLIWVHKIIKQVQGGWIIEMRETTKNSRETTKKKIEAQGKGGANARYGKQQLDQKKSFKWYRTVTIDQSRKQETVKKLKGPISIPMFTTNPNQHMKAHLLTWLHYTTKRRQKKQAKPEVNKGNKRRITQQKTQTGTK